MFDVEKIEKNCLRCKSFRLIDELVGSCRVNKDTNPELPEKKLQDSCERWRDCGQQYYIRVGWLKNKAKS